VVTTYGEYPIPDNIASLDYYKRLHGHCDLFVCTLGRLVQFVGDGFVSF
jgi:hypothetical protein